jgi:hypothetical protein
MQVTRRGAGLKDLLAGIVAIFLALILIAYTYAYTLGVSSGGDVAVRQEGIPLLFLMIVFILFLGIIGGLEIGRYLEKVMNEKNRQIPSPPPP